MKNKVFIGMLIASCSLGNMLKGATTYGFKNTMANTELIIDIMAPDGSGTVRKATSVGPLVGKVHERSEADALARGSFDIVAFEIRDKNRNFLKKIEWPNRTRNSRNFKIVEDADKNPTIVEWNDQKSVILPIKLF